MGMPVASVFGKRRNIIFRITLSASAVALMAALVYVGAGHFRGPGAGERSPQNLSDASRRADVEEARRDSDNDGLKDWEEAIWRTDPKNPDTDADGATDGEEVTQNRDPLKQAPGDTLSAADGSDASAGAPNTGENLTIDLARKLLESGVLSSVDGTGKLTSTDFLKKLSLPEGLDPKAILDSAAVIKRTDITIANRDDTEAAREYFRAVSAAYRHIAAFQETGDIGTLETALTKNDLQTLDELDGLIAGLDKTIAEIKAAPAPPSYAAFAVRELNYLLQTRKAVEIFSNTASDPVTTALILPRRLELLYEISKFHTDTNRALVAKGIWNGL